MFVKYYIQRLHRYETILISHLNFVLEFKLTDDFDVAILKNEAVHAYFIKNTTHARCPLTIPCLLFSAGLHPNPTGFVD